LSDGPVMVLQNAGGSASGQLRTGIATCMRHPNDGGSAAQRSDAARNEV